MEIQTEIACYKKNKAESPMAPKKNAQKVGEKFAGKKEDVTFVPDSVAQLVEHRPFKARVLGSRPS